MPINTPQNNKNTPTQRNQRRSFDSEIFDIFVTTQEDFMKLSATEKQRYNIGGGQSMQKMFYNYFMDKHGYNLATKIDTPEFAVYLANFEKKGYTLNEILERSDRLHDELKPARNELNLLEEVLTNFEAFARNLGTTNPALVHLYTDFVAFAGLNPAPNYIGNASLIKNVEDVYRVRDNFLQANPAFVLSDQQKEDAKHILDQGVENADLTEKIYIQTMIRKISARLRNPQKAVFDAEFTPLTALSSGNILVRYDTLSGFKDQWEDFVAANGPFTAQVQGDLDTLKIDFRDIKKELIDRRIATNDDFQENISKRDDKFKKMFGRILIPKVFEEAKDSKEFYFSAIENIKDSFTGFPPYLNQLMKIYPYREGDYAADPDVNRYWTDIQAKRTELQAADISSEDKTRLTTEILELERNLNQKRWELYADYVTTQDPAVGVIFKKLVDAKFDFSELSDTEKKDLMTALASAHFQQMKDDQVLDYLGLNTADFEAFVEELMDLSSDELTIPTPGGSVDLKFAKDADGNPKKLIMGGGYEQLPKISNMSDIKDLPMSFTFDASSSNRDFFENSILFDDLFYDVNGQKIAESYKVTLKAANGDIIGPGYLSAVGGNNTRDTHRNNEGDDLFFFTEPLNKLDPNQERKEIHYNGAPVKMKTGEVQNDYSIEINDEDKELALTGSQIGQLLLGYTIGKANESRPNMTEEEKEELEAKLGNGFSSFKDTERNNPEGAHSDSDEAPEDTTAETAEQQAAGFDKAFKALKGYDGEFKPGVSFVGRYKESPYPGEGGRWVEIKVVKDWGTHMDVELSGAGRGLHPDLEGEKFTKIQKTKEQIESWETSFNKDLFVVDKQSRGKKAFNEQIKVIKNARGSRESKGLDIFVTKTHFDGSNFVLDDEKIGKPGEYITTFESEDLKCEIKHKNGNFQVEMNFEDYNDKGEEATYKHTETMSYYQFVLFLAEKSLLPVSKREKAEREKLEKQQASGDTGGGWATKIYKIKHIKAFVKNIVKGWKDKQEQKLEEEVSDLTDWAVGDKGIYKLLATIVPGGRGENFDMMDAEHQEKIEENIKKKIEAWKDRISKTPDRGGKTRYEIHVQPIIKSGDGRKDPYKTGGAMLAMIEKGSLYQRNEVAFGDWVKIMFGSQAHARFMYLYGEKKKQIDQEYTAVDAPAVALMTEELQRLEVSFINDLLSQGNMKMFSKVQDPSGDKNKAYSLQQAKVWSKWFGKELQSTYTEKTGKSAFEKKFEEIGTVSYEYAESQYKWYITNGAPQEAFPYLKKMHYTVKKAKHTSINAMHVSAAMLSGIFNHGTDKGIKDAFTEMCRGIGFTPGILVADAKHAEYVKSLYNLYTDGAYDEFMKKHGYKDSDLDIPSMKTSGKFIKDFEKWRKSGNGRKIMDATNSKNSKFFDILDDKNKILTESDTKALKLVKGFLNEDGENAFDEKPAGNPANFMNVGPLNSSLSIIRKRMDIKDGTYKSNEFPSRLLWLGIKNDLPTENMSGQVARMEYITKKFFDFCGGIVSKRQFTRVLATAKHYAEMGQSEHAEDILEYMIKGQALKHYRSKLSPNFESVLDLFKKFFMNNLSNFNSSNMKDSFGKDAEDDFKNKFKYHDMNDYNDLMLLTSLKRDSQDFKNKRKRGESQIYINHSLYELDRYLKNNDLVDELTLKVIKPKGAVRDISRNASGTLPGTATSGVNTFGVANFGTSGNGDSDDGDELGLGL